MNHLDEGTIHAWLDGALDEAQAAEVSKHAASCAQCGAAVAEARGLIAGASRVLTSLDDVPSGVLPRLAPAVASAKPPRRSWQAAPWVTGIAAALILAIGVKEWRDRPSARAAFLPVPATTADSLRAGETVRLDQRIVDSALRDQRPRALQPVSAPPPVATPAAKATLGAGGSGAAGSGAAGVQSADIGGEMASKSSAGLKKTGVAEAPTVAAPPTPVAPEAAAVSQRMMSESPKDAFELRQSAGCYRTAVSGPSTEAATQVASMRAQDASRRMARSAPTAAMAPSSAEAGSAAEGAGTRLVRLDSALVAGARRVYSASGAQIGTWRVDGDTARLLIGGVLQSVPLSSRVACRVAP